MWLVALRPDASAMRLDDRTADGQPHPHPVLLRAEEWLKDLVIGAKPRSTVADLRVNEVLDLMHTHAEDTLALRGLHGLDPVAHEIDQHLLKLHTVQAERRKVG